MSNGHDLPPARDGEAGTPGAPAAPPPEPTHAERARTLVASTNRGVLSTLALDPPGYPFGSVATYAVDPTGRPVLFVSRLAEHTRNAAADPRASLIVAEPVAEGSDPLAAGRVTLVGELLPVAGEEEVRSLYAAANPSAASYLEFGDFAFWRLEVRAVRYVGGYGRMSWVEAAGYAGADPDPLAGATAVSILGHMNADHGDSLVLMARVFGGAGEASAAVMTAIDRYGFDVVVEEAGGRRALRLGFDAPLPGPAEVRPEMIRLVERARAEAGRAGSTG